MKYAAAEEGGMGDGVAALVAARLWAWSCGSRLVMVARAILPPLTFFVVCSVVLRVLIIASVF